MSVSYQTREVAGGSNDAIFRTYYASSTITAGQAVIFDFTKTGEQKCEFVNPTPTGSKDFIGVAVYGASTGEIVQIQQGGFCAFAKIYGNFTAGDTLCVSDNAEGVLEVITSNHGRDHSRRALAMETITGDGNTTHSPVEIYIFPVASY